MSLLNASRQPMHANAYLTGLQAPSFTTPEPVDLWSPPRPIESLRFSPSLSLSLYLSLPQLRTEFQGSLTVKEA